MRNILLPLSWTLSNICLCLLNKILMWYYEIFSNNMMLAVINSLPLFISWTAPSRSSMMRGLCGESNYSPFITFTYEWMHQTAFITSASTERQRGLPQIKKELVNQRALLPPFNRRAQSYSTEYLGRCRTLHSSCYGPNELIPNRACIWHPALFICLVYTLPGGSPFSWSPCTEFTFSSWSEWMQSRGVERKSLHTLRTQCTKTNSHPDIKTSDLLSKEENRTRRGVTEIFTSRYLSPGVRNPGVTIETHSNKNIYIHLGFAFQPKVLKIQPIRIEQPAV